MDDHNEKQESGSLGKEDSLEKGAVLTKHVVQTDERYHFDASDLDRVQRRLKQRHVQMIAIAGTIGTGLFLGSGRALSGAGPLGALIAYALVGTVTYASLCSVGEMTTHAPISGTFPHYVLYPITCYILRKQPPAARWVDPAFGFAVGWNYFYSHAISTPVEITAAGILLGFWDLNQKHQYIYTGVICLLVCVINIFGVRYFGESEFVFSLIKLSMITGLILVGLVIDLGGTSTPRLGFHYWKDPGAVKGPGLVKSVNTDRFLGILSVLVQASFSFQGMELVTIAASETESPRRNITKAIHRVFYRILIFYMLGILMIGLLVPYNDPALLKSTGTAAQSPFVIAMNRAGIKVLPHIINAGVFTSAFSAGNSFLYCSSRILYGLALRGQAPKFLTYCTKNGLPLVAVLTSSSFCFLAFMNVSKGAATVFSWFVNLATTAGFVGWFSMNLTYIFFYRGMVAQGIDLRKNYYHNRLQPYLAFWGVGWTAFFILITGFEVFFKFNVSDFLTAYVNIPIFAILYFGYKFTKRSKIWKPHEMDFVTGIPSIEETEIPEVPPRTILEKIAAALF